MGHILHDWDLAQKQTLIAQGICGLPTGGALIIYEAIIDDDRRENAFGLLMSLNMLIETPGGLITRGPNAPSGCTKLASRPPALSTWLAPRAWLWASNSWCGPPGRSSSAFAGLPIAGFNDSTRSR